MLHALIDFFAARKERHRIRVCASTGSAAVLVDGQTYHYLLGFKDRRIDDILAKSAYDRKATANCPYTDATGGGLGLGLLHPSPSYSSPTWLECIRRVLVVFLRNFEGPFFFLKHWSAW